jgi:hypothetical protein
MSSDQGPDSLNRRHFIVTAIGASATLAASSEPPSTRAATASRGTAFTGDTIDGKKIVSALDINDLDVSFQEVVHPALNEEAEVVEALANPRRTEWTPIRMRR